MVARKLQLAIVFGVSCGMLGCKSPLGMFSSSTPAASASPSVRYDGLSTDSGTAAVNGVKPSDGAITKAWKSTTGAVSSALTPKSMPASDAVSLNSKPAKVGADLYIAAARLLENKQKYSEAQAQYEQALKVEPKNLTALISLARVLDKQENSQGAIATYQKAIKLHPKSALVYNDLGLCYARRRDLVPAQQMLQKAIELEPQKVNYRNNLATVLVDMNRSDDAFRHLLAVQPEGVAHYNLAFLLNSRGQREQAIGHLHQAIAKDPALTPARELLAQLDGSSQQPQMALAPVVGRGPSALPQPGPQAFRPQPQMNRADLQPPEISVGPATGPQSADERTYRITDQGLAPPQEESPSIYRRTSHAVEVPQDDSPPAPIRLTDEDEDLAEDSSASEDPAPQEPNLLQIEQ